MDMKKNLIALAVSATLAGCGGGGGGTSGSSSFSVGGAPVDGPLAYADASLYALDLTTGDLSADPVDTGETDSKAALTGISIDLSAAQPPYILEFKSNPGTIDLDTGEAPLIGTLRTVITQSTIDNKTPIYATPLTTMAVDLALQWYGEHLASGEGSAEVFEQLLTRAQATVKETLGFGLVDDSVDIFATPSLITEDVTSEEEVAKVIKYRAAAEAAAQVVQKLKEGGSGDTSSENIMSLLKQDLADGAIDGNTADAAVSYPNPDANTALQETIQSATADMRSTAEIAERLNAEKETTAPGADALVVAVAAEDNQAPEPKLYADVDADGIPDNEDDDLDNDGIKNINDAFKYDASEWLDTDGDKIGNNADNDDDGDGVADADDDFPLDETRNDATDQDGDGWNSEIDPDDQDKTLPGVAYVDTDRDGLPDSGIEGADTDDDNDGVADGEDAFPLDPKESVDTDGDKIGNNADTDDDNDGVEDKLDPKPLDPEISSWADYDLDRDGIPNDVDDDADGDGVPSSEDPNDLKRDTDGDGYLDNRDDLPEDKTEHLDTDGDGIGNNADTDDDDDGVADADDAFPLDPEESLDTDGDKIGNNADTDDDGDGVADTDDQYPLDSTRSIDTDNDGIDNSIDTDDDGDGVADTDDAFPLDPAESLDTDGDKIGNNADTDDDGDGVADTDDAFPLDDTETVDTDGDGTGNNADTDDDGDGVPDDEDAYPTDKTASYGIVIEGTVAKGIIARAEVSAFSIVDGVESSTALETTTTNPDGSYEIIIPVVVDGFSGGPVMVRVNGNTEGATMVCDVSGGCDADGDGTKETAFGETFDINGKDLTMAAALNLPDNGRTLANITTQTTMAAALATGMGGSADDIAAANGKVANLFGLTGTLTALPVVDITNQTVFEAASELTQQNALLSTAIWRAARKTGRGVNGMSRYYAERDGILYINDDDPDLEDSHVSLEDIFGQMGQLLNGSMAAYDVPALYTWGEANWAWAKSISPYAQMEDQTSTTGTASDLEKLKGFFSDLRLLVTSAGAQKIEEGAQVFDQQLAMAGALTSDQAFAVEQATLKAVSALGEAMGEEYDALYDELTPPGSPYTATNGVSVTITAGSGDARTFRANGSVDGIAVDISLVTTPVLNVSETGSSVEGDETVDFNVTTKLSGTAASDSFKMTLTDGSVTANGSAYSFWGDTFGDDTKVSQLKVAFDGTWEQLASAEVTNPVKFQGDIGLTLTNLASSYLGKDWTIATYEESTSFETLNLSLKGTFSDTQGNSFVAGLSAEATGNGVVFSSKESYTWDPVVGDYGEGSYTETGETVDKYVDVNLSVRFTANLPGVDSATEVMLYGERTGLETEKGSITLSFLGKTYKLSGISTSEVVKIENGDGVVMRIQPSPDDSIDVRLGAPGGDVLAYAKISDTYLGTVIRYSDGTFETF